MSRITLFTLAWIALSGPTAAEENSRPVVVELFTSEGCSSCPPADAALSDLARAAASSGRPIIALAWHVDYWDRLGWPDPFASADHTARQRSYAATLGQRGLYTPQAVVDGRVDVVGSRRARLKAAIEAAGGPSLAVRAEVKRDGPRYHVTPRIDGAPAGARVLVALTESGLSVEVPRGENAGRTLRHDHVVRRSAEAKPGATVTLEAPVGLRTARAAVVVLVQGADGAVLGATEIRPAG